MSIVQTNSNFDKMKALIQQFSGQDNTITVPKIYIEIVGRDHETAALLNQIVFWSDKGGKHDGWFYKTYVEWEDELMMTTRQLRRSVKKLERLGFIETKLKRANGSPTVHYHLNFDAVVEAIMAFVAKNSEPEHEENVKNEKSNMTKRHNPTIQNVTIQPDERSQSITEDYDRGSHIRTQQEEAPADEEPDVSLVDESPPPPNFSEDRKPNPTQENVGREGSNTGDPPKNEGEHGPFLRKVAKAIHEEYDGKLQEERLQDAFEGWRRICELHPDWHVENVKAVLELYPPGKLEKRLEREGMKDWRVEQRKKRAKAIQDLLHQAGFETILVDSRDGSLFSSPSFYEPNFMKLKEREEEINEEMQRDFRAAMQFLREHELEAA